jgi:hypothetical protein
MSGKVEYSVHKEFLPSLKVLAQKGGPFQKAANRVRDAYDKAVLGSSYEHAFQDLKLTNHGESRIANCRKFDLTGASRLVTAYANNVCVFLFAGDHETTDQWLEKNKGMDIVGTKDGKTTRLSTVYISDNSPAGHGPINSPIDLQTNGPVLHLLSSTYRTKLLAGLDKEIISDLETVETDTHEDQILHVSLRVQDNAHSNAIFDVLLALRSADKIKAKNRIDAYTGEAKVLKDLPPSDIKTIGSSESIVRVADVDPVLFDHFVRNASFKDWMLYLHPAQRSIVDRDFPGSARLAGVSGSGKTCVVIHRAVRLAKVDQKKKVLIVTLNEALSKLIHELITAQCGSSLPQNIDIKSIFQLCYDKLAVLEPDKRNYYGRRTTTPNAFAPSEHIDEIWNEYFHCHANNRDADKMLNVIQTLLVRNVFPQDYLRQELDYVRSALSPNERENYLEMERPGRVIPLLPQFRRSVLAGLEGWESKMDAVGAVDDLGIVTALYRHLDSLTAEYHHTLVDEVQDLGTLELHVIRKLTHTGDNDLFLCGDTAQSVQTKYANLKSAGIEITPAHSISLKQNYRNSSQILGAAHQVLTSAFEKIPAGTIDLEILPPEYANFTSASPSLLKAGSIAEELGFALTYVNEMTPPESGKKACIALCGYTQFSVEQLGRELGLPALSSTSDISASHLFISDLEQTKGFEFDLMLILNCSDGVIPHPQLPEHEWFRDLSKLYVAMTRAKTELVVSYTHKPSVFLLDSLNWFTSSSWADYDIEPQSLAIVRWPEPALQTTGDLSKWNVTGLDFLKLREAVGLSQATQDAVTSRVTGADKMQRRATGGSKQLEWKTFYDFLRAMQNPQNAVSVISKEALAELNSRLGNHLKRQVPSETPPRQKDNETPSPSISAKSNSQQATSVVGRLVVPSETFEKPLRVHKPKNASSFSSGTHSAYLLASLLVAQQASAIQELEVGASMSSDLLHFLLDSPPINDWISKGWLRRHKTSASKIVLTRTGLDECLSRCGIHPASHPPFNPSLKVQPSRVEAFRQTILKGP